MPDYKRFVAYIYLYENGIKMKNTGFAKVYVRDGMCTVEIKLRGIPSVSGRTSKVYIFTRKKGNMLGTYIGDIKPVNGSGTLTARTEERNMWESGLTFSQMSGIYIQDGENRAYAAEWDELGIQVKNFGVYEEEATENGPFLESQEEPVREESPFVPAEPEPVAEPEPIPESDPVPEPELIPESEPVVEPESAAEPEQPVEPSASRSANASQQAKKALVRKRREEEPLSWENMLDRFQVFPAFQDEEIRDCIRIQPKDLAHLPKKEWALGNNSFMLHGYYNYKYLLMGRKISSGRESVILGVPGVYHHQEKMMANMFGFPHFKPAKKTDTAQGVFGYWYRIVTMAES